MKYEPREYWEKRLRKHFNLKGVGCVRFNESYNKYLYSLKEMVLNRVLNEYHINVKGKSILDVGCGTGFFIEYYRERGAAKILGIDIAPISINNLRKKFTDVEFQVLDISKEIPFKNIFDLVNAFDVMYHIIDEDRFRKAILNICNATRRKGFVLITDVFGKRDIRPAAHVKFRCYLKYKQLLLDGGVRILGIFPLYYLMGRGLPATLANNLALPFYLLDKTFHKLGFRQNGNNIKLLLGRKM